MNFKVNISLKFMCFLSKNKKYVFQNYFIKKMVAAQKKVQPGAAGCSHHFKAFLQGKFFLAAQKKCSRVQPSAAIILKHFTEGFLFSCIKCFSFLFFI